MIENIVNPGYTEEPQNWLKLNSQARNDSQVYEKDRRPKDSGSLGIIKIDDIAILSIEGSLAILKSTRYTLGIHHSNFRKRECHRERISVITRI